MRFLRYYKEQRGSVLIIAILLLFVMLTLAVAIISQENISRVLFLGAEEDRLKTQTAQNADARFKLTFSKSTNTLKSFNTSGDFSVTSDDRYQMSGNYSPDGGINSAVRAIPEHAGKDFDNIPEVGFSKTSTAQAYRNNPVPPWYSIITLNASDIQTQNPVSGTVKDVPANNRHVAVYSSAFPYAVYAPHGSIRVKEVHSWTNPTQEEVRKAAEVQDTKSREHQVNPFTDVFPADLYAGKSIDAKITYGKAYSISGPIAIKGGGIGFSGIPQDKVHNPENERSISKHLRTQLVTAYEEIGKDTLDKTRFVIGTPLDIFSLIKGCEKIDNVFSLQQALEVPFPTIPTFSTAGIVTTIMFHAPYPPDNFKWNSQADILTKYQDQYSPAVKDIAGVMQTLGIPKPDASSFGLPIYNSNAVSQAQKNLNSYFDKFKWAMSVAGLPANASVDQAQDALNRMAEKINSSIPSEAEQAQQAQKALDYIASWDKVKDFEDKLGEYQDFLGFLNNASATGKKLQASLEAAKVAEEPQSRNDENFSNEGYPFVNVFKQLGTMLKNMCVAVLQGRIAELPDIVGKALVNKIRVVHYAKSSQDSYDPDFFRPLPAGKKQATGFEIKSTWVIPRGRTLKLDCTDVVIRGDLWLQDGSCLFVTGNLQVKNPNKTASSKFDFKPSGRIIIGRGAILLVGKNLSCEGTPYHGSVSVPSPLGKIQYITSGIICKGKMELPNGIMPAVTIDELAGLVNNDALQTLLRTVDHQAPTIGKVAGPFHTRESFIASHPACFRIVVVPLPPPLPPIPVPVPTPTTTNNINTTIYDIVSRSYSIELNTFLGEYLYPQADWWIFGEGVVPTVPKIDMPATLTVLLSFDIQKFSLDVTTLAQTLFGKLGESIIRDIITTVVKRIAAEIVSAVASSLEPTGELSGVTQLIAGRFGGFFDNCNSITEQDDIVTHIFSSASAQFTATLNELKKGIDKELHEHILNNVDSEEHFQNALVFNEVPGILLYADDSLGGKTDDKVPAQKLGGLMSSGLIISRTSMEIKSRKTIGCLISLEGSVNASVTCMMYYPYFTQASLYMPKKMQNSTQLTGCFENMALTGEQDVKSTAEPMEIGVPYNHVVTEGWEK